VVRSIAVLICVGGCSFGLSGPDPNRPATTAPSCETSMGRVEVDAAAAVVGGLLGLSAFSNNDTGLGVGMALTSAIYGVAALHGNSAVSRCRAAYQQYDVAMMGVAKARSAPAIAAKPEDPYEAPAVAAKPPPIPRPLPPEAKPPPPEARPVEPTPQPVKLDDADAFHVPVGAPEAVRPSQPKPNPAKPASDDVWRDFWRGVP